MYKTKVDIFLETGKTECKRHGSHDDWYFTAVKMKLKKGKVQRYRSVSCRACARESTKRIHLKNPDLQDKYRYSFTGTLNRMLAQARKRAKDRKLPFDLDINWLKETLESQNNTCAYSGITFDFSKPKVYSENRNYLPSIDQKTAGMGYTKENSAVVCVAVNIMKYELSFNDFLEICSKIVKHNE